MVKDNPANWDDEELALHIERLKESARNYRTAADKVDALAAEYQAELDRRAYLDQQPETKE